MMTILPMVLIIYSMGVFPVPIKADLLPFPVSLASQALIVPLRVPIMHGAHWSAFPTTKLIGHIYASCTVHARKSRLHYLSTEVTDNKCFSEGPQRLLHVAALPNRGKNSVFTPLKWISTIHDMIALTGTKARSQFRR